MKHIVKADRKIQKLISSWLKKAKRKNEADWNRFSHDNAAGGIYTTTKATLLREQGSICCYCERQIAESPCHIEHLHGKGRFPKQMFQYENLLASCDGFPDKAEHCCGHKRAQQGNPDLPISPLDADCESRFRYTGLGTIKPATEGDADAENTIAALGLNSPTLRANRKALMYQLEDYVKGMSDSEFSVYVERWLQTDNNGCFPAFFTTIRQYAKDLLA